MSAIMAAIAVAALTWAASDRPRMRARTMPGTGSDASALPLAFVAELLAVAVRHGASIPRALSIVGSQAGPGLGQALTLVARSLERGGDWDSAWARPVPSGELDTLCETLEPSWRHGVSPLLRLEAVIDQLNADQRERIERQSAALAIRVLLPCGLCFLPSFVLVGIVPVIAAFI